MITVFGSCRQDSIENTNSIKETLTYPHYSTEILNAVLFCKYGFEKFSKDETSFIFRTPILENKPVSDETFYRIHKEFTDSKLFILEIASKKTYTYKDRFVHHIIKDHNYANSNDIIVGEETDDIIEKNIIKIKEEIGNRPIIIVSHLVTKENGSRYELCKLLEKICKKYDIVYINPIDELKKSCENFSIFFNMEERVLSHYTDIGHKEIKKVYEKFIEKLI